MCYKSRVRFRISARISDRDKVEARFRLSVMTRLGLRVRVMLGLLS